LTKYEENTTYLGNASSLFKAQMWGLMQQHLGVHGNEFCIRTTVRKTKDFVTDLVGALGPGRNAFNDAAELDAQRRRCLWRDGVEALALDDVHAIDAKRLDPHDRLARPSLRLWDLGVDEEGVAVALSTLDIYVMLC
jgi:hypothetical protein